MPAWFITGIKSIANAFLKDRTPITIAQIAVAFSIEVAPLSHIYLCEILNTSPVIEYFDEQLTIIIFHHLIKSSKIKHLLVMH